MSVNVSKVICNKVDISTYKKGNHGCKGCAHAVPHVRNTFSGKTCSHQLSCQNWPFNTGRRCMDLQDVEQPTLEQLTNNPFT